MLATGPPSTGQMCRSYNLLTALYTMQSTNIYRMTLLKLFITEIFSNNVQGKERFYNLICIRRAPFISTFFYSEVPTNLDECGECHHSSWLKHPLPEVTRPSPSPPSGLLRSLASTVQISCCRKPLPAHSGSDEQSICRSRSTDKVDGTKSRSFSSAANIFILYTTPYSHTLSFCYPTLLTTPLDELIVQLESCVCSKMNKREKSQIKKV